MMSTVNTLRTWVNGVEMGPDDRSYFATDRGATLGDAVFDTCLCLNGKVVWSSAHGERTRGSANIFEHVFDDDLLAYSYSLAHERRAPSVLRVAITRGPGRRGLGLDQSTPSQITTTLSPLPHGIQFSPRRMMITDIVRNQTSLTSQHKTAAYLDAIMAQKQAQAEGMDDAIFLNGNGNVCCTTLANIFVVKNDEIRTPAQTDGVISGVTRGRIIALARQLGYVVSEGNISVDELLGADEVFASNSLRLVMPVPNFGHTCAVSRDLAVALVSEIEKQVGVHIPLSAGFDAIYTRALPPDKTG